VRWRKRCAIGTALLTFQSFFLHPSDCEKLAAAQYIDMLNDTPRNEKYRQAIVKAVQSKGEPQLVIDIGTGTGLLSVMAGQAGAKKVYGCDSSEVRFHSPCMSQLVGDKAIPFTCLLPPSLSFPPHLV
jgi:hypothetical protein